MEQKSLRICFLVFLGGQKKFDFFENFDFFGTPFEKIFFFTSQPRIYLLLGLLVDLSQKAATKNHFTGGGRICPPPVQSK